MKSAGPVRILSFVPEALPTFRSDVAALAGRHLPAHGVQTHLVGHPGASKAGDPAGSMEMAFDVSRNSGFRFFREWHYVVLSIRKLLAANARRFEVIQVRDMVSIGLLALVFARLKGLRFVFWMSFLMSEGRAENARSAWARGQRIKAILLHVKAATEAWVLYRIVLPASDFVFVQSDEMKRYVARKHVTESKMLAVPMCIDFPEGAQSSESRKLHDVVGKSVIGYLGTLDSARRLDLLIDALAAVRKAGLDACLVLIGGSENKQDEEDLLAHARRHGLRDQVSITGWLARPEALQYLLRCDVCVSPIPRGKVLDTGSPTKLLEYMALGLPCIANDNPDQRKVIEESGAGWLVCGDPPDYAAAILQVLRDPAEARASAAKGPAYVAAHRSYATLAASVAAQYRRIIARA